jgi:hypothetical protein
MPLITRNPTSHTTPGSLGGSAFDSHDNTSGSSSISFSGPGGGSKSCDWTSFVGVGGQIVSVDLKFDYSYSGTGASGGTGSITIDRSLDNGSNWSSQVSASGTSFSSSGTQSFTLGLSAGQDLSQVRVRANLTWSGGPGSSFNGSISLSNIRIEVTIVPAVTPIICV